MNAPATPFRFVRKAAALGAIAMLFCVLACWGAGIFTPQKIALPPPVEWAAPDGMSAAPGDPVNVTFTGAAAAQAPVVAEWNRTAGPGESFTLTGINFTLKSGARAGSDTRVRLWGRTWRGGTLRTLPLWKVSSDLIMTTVPRDLPFGVYFVWVENAAGPGAPVILNRAQGEWLGPLGSTAAPGDTKRLFGKTLASGLEGGTSHVYLRPAGSTGPPTPCAVTKVEPFAVWFTVPLSLAPGDYDVFVHNGHGGSYGWSAPQKLTVEAPWVRGAKAVSLGAATGDRTADLNAAIDAVTQAPHGGTVSLGAGTFPIRGTVLLKANVALVGAGKARTILLGQGGAVKFSASAGDHIAVQDLAFRADTGVPVFHINSASFSGGDYNQDLLIRNVDFQVSPDAVSAIDCGLQARRVEITGCTMDGVLHGALADWWIHDNEFHGGRNEPDGAIRLSSHTSVRHGNLVLENCTARTVHWPVDPNGSANYSNFTPPLPVTDHVPTGFIWCSRFVTLSANAASLTHAYIAHNLTNDVAIDFDNKGEQILFHSSEANAYGQVSSNSGTTLTIRTDGAIDGDPNFILHTVSQLALGPIRSVPNSLRYGKSIDHVAYVILVDGTGRGQIREIASHTATTITVESPWRVPPDSTTKFMLDYIYLGQLIYQNDLHGFPAHWALNAPEGDVPSSCAVDFDGNTFFSVAARNTNTRTVFGDNLNGYLLAPSYWNELRNETTQSAFCSGIQINARGGNWTANPTRVTILGVLCLGDWVRNGRSTSTQGFESMVGGQGTLPANKLLAEGCGFENGTVGTTLLASSYGDILFRNNGAAPGTAPRLLLGDHAQPILIHNEVTGPFQAVKTWRGFTAGSRVQNQGPTFP